MKTPIFLLVAACLGIEVQAQAPRIFPPGEFPQDVRLGALKELDGYFPFTPADSREAWEARAERVRRQILVSQGLWPMPERTALNAVIHGRIEREDYTIEKVYFESMPGFFVSGNLYRPKGRSGPFPGVLCTLGHWPNGRLGLLDEKELAKEQAMGGELLAGGGHSRFQSLCVQFARLGCIAFQYDMLGYADNLQIPHGIAHGFAKQRAEMNTVENWGLFSPQAEAHAQSIMGLQTWNSLRAVDFLQSLPDLDPTRIGMTGGSGGGTQTLMCGALDPRITVAFPAVMVSTAMQGGCSCENASLLRIGTGNVEFAALFGPRPLGMTAANDWTKEMATKGYPELQAHFALLGVPEKVRLWPMLQFPHNYNAPSRAAIYSWFGQHFGLKGASPAEREYPVSSPEELTVWDSAHPAPEGGPEFERRLLHHWDADAQRQLHQSAEQFQKLAGPAWEIVLGRSIAECGPVNYEAKQKTDRGRYIELSGLLRNARHGEEIPAVFLHPKTWNGQTMLVLTQTGKAGLYTDAGIKPEFEKCLESGVSVIGIDLFNQGEFLAEGSAEVRKSKNPREVPAYTFGYNPALFAQRVHDVLSVIEFVRHDEHPTRGLTLVGLGSTGPLAAAARCLAGNALSATVLQSDGFRFARLLDFQDRNFLPGAAKYGDLPGLLALGRGPVLVLGEDAEFSKQVQPLALSRDWLTTEPASADWLVWARARF